MYIYKSTLGGTCECKNSPRLIHVHIPAERGDRQRIQIGPLHCRKQHTNPILQYITMHRVVHVSVGPPTPFHVAGAVRDNT